MIDLKEKTDDIKELEIPEIKNENNEENIDNQQIVVTEKKSKKWIIISSLIIVIILLIFSTIFALINIGNKKIIKGILIENIDVSNLTIEEANSLLNEITDTSMWDIIICFIELRQIRLSLQKCSMIGKILCISCLVFRQYHKSP